MEAEAHTLGERIQIIGTRPISFGQERNRRWVAGGEQRDTVIVFIHPRAHKEA